MSKINDSKPKSCTTRSDDMSSKNRPCMKKVITVIKNHKKSIITFGCLMLLIILLNILLFLLDESHEKKIDDHSDDKKFPKYNYNHGHGQGNDINTHRSDVKNFIPFSEMDTGIPQIEQSSSYSGPGYCNYCEGASQITCSDFQIGELEDMKNQLRSLSQQNCKNEKLLKQYNQLLLAGKFDRELNSNRNQQLKPKHLIINNSDLDQLDKNTFSRRILEDLSNLTISNSTVSLFQKSSFLGSNIETIAVRNRFLKSTTFESGVFDYIRYTLRHLQLQRCIDDYQVLKNITGSNAKYLKITTLDLSNNVIEELNSGLFSKSLELETLILRQSKIQKIYPRTFTLLHKLEKLVLSDNQLFIIPESSINWIYSPMQIDVRNNPLLCNCSLFWLQYISELYLPESCVDAAFEDILCEDPTAKKILPLPAVTNKRIIDTPTVEISPRKKFNPDLDLKYLNVHALDDYSSYLIEIEVIGVNINFNLQDDRIPIYYMFLQSDSDNYFAGTSLNNSLLIRDIEENHDILMCLYNAVLPLKVNILRLGKVYSVCLLEPIHRAVKAWDFIALLAPQDFDHRPWITNSLRAVIIIGMSFSVVFTCLLTTVIVFFVIRQHPNLIKGNKRVIIIGSKAADALVMPKDYEYQQYAKTSTTCRFPFKRGSIQRTSSSSYINRPAAPPYLRKSSLVRKTCSVNYPFEQVYEVPPPLPPNHPIRERRLYRRDASS